MPQHERKFDIAYPARLATNIGLVAIGAIWGWSAISWLRVMTLTALVLYGWVLEVDSKSGAVQVLLATVVLCSGSLVLFRHNKSPLPAFLWWLIVGVVVGAALLGWATILANQ